MTHSIPAAALEQHIAILGKTGSGKTSTGKLAIEQVVATGARVCILDPIKSDWWGLTSSADGQRPGLPFDILGGPRGHVPLHEKAGKAIGEIVASGSLPLSIIDMADFAPGGQAHFFVDFAPALLRRMRGVVYLVIEEAHLFAPKERSGIGAENMSIHWAKTLATAGRSKGIRLVILTQRVQSLHNALLGSCDTMITHRLTAPADQEPVLKWLRANVTPEIREKVASSLSSLRTGSGWLCAGEARLFELLHFPRIQTYDNSATPTGDSLEHAVQTAPVDQDKLRAIVGEAVAAAEANDPAQLKKRVAELERELRARPPETKTVYALDESARAHAYEQGRQEGERAALARLADMDRSMLGDVQTASAGLAAIAEILEKRLARPIPAPAAAQPGYQSFVSSHVNTAPPLHKSAPMLRSDRPAPTAGPGKKLPSGERRILTALAQYPAGRTKSQIAILTGYAINGGGFNNHLSALRTRRCIEGGGDRIVITATGIDELGSYAPLPTGRALLEHWLSQLEKAPRAILQAVADVYPRALSKDQVAAATGYEPNGGGFNNALSRLRTLELISGRGEIRASDALFGE